MPRAARGAVRLLLSGELAKLAISECTKAMSIINSLVNYLFECIAAEASKLGGDGGPLVLVGQLGSLSFPAICLNTPSLKVPMLTPVTKSKVFFKTTKYFQMRSQNTYAAVLQLNGVKKRIPELKSILMIFFYFCHYI